MFFGIVALVLLVIGMDGIPCAGDDKSVKVSHNVDCCKITQIVISPPFGFQFCRDISAWGQVALVCWVDYV